MSKRQPGCDPKVPDSVTHAENPVEELRTDRRRISLRVKVPAEDGTAVVEMTSPGVPENGLQAFGDWVLAALEQHADGAAEAARLMIAALRERDWEGDDALADQLDALLEGGAITDLRPLPVDLDELAGILEGDPMYGGGRVDLATGDVWPAPAVDYAREVGQEDEDESEDPDKWLWVHCEVRGTATGTWSCSSERCVIPDAPTGWRSPFPGEERSGGSRTSWGAGPEN
jgi:hypothetical protein